MNFRSVALVIGIWGSLSYAAAGIAKPAAKDATEQYPLITRLPLGESSSGSQPFGEELAAEIEQTVKQYQSWGLERESTRMGSIRMYGDDPISPPIDWSAKPTSQVTRERFLRSGDRFRSDCVAPKYQRRSFAFDGIIGRLRNLNLVHNGPLPNTSAPFHNEFTPPVPHTLLVGDALTPRIHWIYDRPRMLRMIRSGSLFGTMRVEKETVDDHPCWKIAWRGVRENEGGLDSFGTIWLARDRGLLPLRQQYRTPLGAVSMERVVAATERFKLDSDTQLWFPEDVRLTLQLDNTLYLGRTRFELTDRYREPSEYEQVAALTKAHETPAKTVVPAYAPYPVLSSLPGPGSVAPSATVASRFRFASFGLLGLAACWMTTALAFSKTRLGRLARDFLRRQRVLLGVCGLVAVASVGYLTSVLPGWSKFGLSWMFAGACGLGWILLSMWLMGERKISLRVVLCGAASAALLFAGYNIGMKRMHVRERMINEIRGQGGQVVIGLWRLDEPGLFLPDAMGRLLGEAWTGRANRAAIDQNQFTARNVDRWCLDEVRWLGIASPDQEPFNLSSDALARIRDTRTLWTLHVEGGYVDGECFEELARFNHLIDVYYHCNERPIDKRIALIPELERLWLTRAVANDDLFEKLSGNKTLECVTLIDPVFTTCSRSQENFGLDWVEIHHATVDAEELKELGKLPCDLVFENCRFQLSPKDQVRLLETPKLTVKHCVLDDQALNCLADSPRLQQVRLAETDVSLGGIETFSKQRPRVAVTME